MKNHPLRLVIGLCLVICFSGDLRAGSFEDGFADRQTRQYEDVFKKYRKAAEQGNSGAQSDLGAMYAKGEGVIQNYKEAVKWYRKAAEQGYAKAQLNLGNRIVKGEGIAEDYIQAHKWYNLAAVNGNLYAIENRDKLADKMTTEQQDHGTRVVDNAPLSVVRGQVV